MKIYRLGPKEAKRFGEDSVLAPVIHKAADGSGSFVTAGTYGKLKPANAQAEELGDTRLEGAKKRLVYSWAAHVNDDAPQPVIDEALLMLAVNPNLQLEYMGRGRFFNEGHLPAAKEHVIWLDIARGRRSYLFRKIDAPVGEIDERIKKLNALYHGISAWMDDPGARFVISLGGGGWRLFAATAILKLADHLLKDRTKVSEIWGSSGGAFLGYVYSQGFDISMVDELGFALYHNTNRALANGSPRSLLRANLRAVFDDLAGRAPTPAMVAWLEELDRRQPPSKRVHAHIPYFAMATNTRRCEPTALADPKHIAPHLRDMIFACSPRDAVAASTAIPFLLRPLRGITGERDDTWLDGSITDENPLALPFVKWLRDRQANPKGTPERLKILSVHLNLRLAESSLVRVLSDLPLLKQTRLLKHAARLIDMSLDSKTYAPLQMLNAMPNVEVLCSKLTLGWMNFNSPKQIPAAIRSGRTFNGWQTVLHANRPIEPVEAVEEEPPRVVGAGS